MSETANSMSGRNEAVILSVKPCWAEAILTGKKTVELRRKFTSKLPPGSTAFIYASAPTSSLVGVVIIERVWCSTPQKLWLEIRSKANVSFNDYQAYFAGAPSASALFLSNAQRFEPPLHIGDLRAQFSFHPPVSWRRATPEEMRLLEYNND